MNLDLERLGKTLDLFRVPSGRKISLRQDYDSSFRPRNLEKDQLKQALSDGVELLAAEQDKLYAQNTQALLVVLQAMDAAGKDSTIKHVMSGINPQGCNVTSFKAPSHEELDHDYLWRCAKALPARGMIGIFNRSYYEEVLVAKVHPEILHRQQLPEHLLNKNLFQRRYQEINNFEQYLVNNGITVLKVFLNVSKAEQKRRFLERIEMSEKNWKFDAGDARERQLWTKYMGSYQDCFNATSTKWAPWYIVPADFKPFTRLAVAHLIYRCLLDMKLKYPTVTKEQRAELRAAREILLNE